MIDLISSIELHRTTGSSVYGSSKSFYKLLLYNSVDQSSMLLKEYEYFITYRV
jgi:hypothetical protein